MNEPVVVVGILLLIVSCTMIAMAWWTHHREKAEMAKPDLAPVQGAGAYLQSLRLPGNAGRQQHAATHP